MNVMLLDIVLINADDSMLPSHKILEFSTPPIFRNT